MTKEEEAIERLEEYLKNSAYKRVDSDFFKNGGWEIVDLEVPQSIETVLNTLKENSAEIKQKNTELAEKSAEIEKYKSLYNKTLKDLVQAEKKKCQKDKINELLINFIYKMSIIRPGTIMYDLREDGFDTSKCGNCKGKSCKNCIKQYFKQKATNNG